MNQTNLLTHVFNPMLSIILIIPTIICSLWHLYSAKKNYGFLSSFQQKVSWILFGTNICISVLLFFSKINILTIVPLLLSFALLSFKKPSPENLLLAFTKNINEDLIILKNDIVVFCIQGKFLSSIPSNFDGFLCLLSADTANFVKKHINKTMINISMNILPDTFLISWYKQNEFLIFNISKQRPQKDTYKFLAKDIIEFVDRPIFVINNESKILMLNEEAEKVNLEELRHFYNKKQIKKAEYEIIGIESNFNIMKSAPIGFIILNSQKNVVYQNKVEIEEIINNPKWNDFLDQVQKSNIHERFFLQEKMCVCYGQYNDNHFVVYVIDEKPLNEIASEFLQKQRLHVVGEMVGGVIHDFNNLIANIIIILEIFIDRNSFNELSENYLDLMRIKHSSIKAADLVKQILQFSKGSSLEKEIINVHNSIDSFCFSISKTLSEKFKLIFNNLSTEDLFVEVKDIFLQQIIMNTVLNARDSMTNGGIITITIKEKKIEVDFIDDGRLIKSGSYCEISVTDNGTGINNENLSKIFEPFFSTKPQKGYGIGLSTVKYIVSKYNGFIKVKSQMNIGSSFFIYLPCIRPKENNIISTLKILFLEDESIILNAFTKFLKEQSFHVIPCSSGEEAINVNDDIDLLITDLNLSSNDTKTMSGNDVANKLRLKNNNLKVIFISGYVSEQNTEKEIFLQKPFTHTELLAAIKKITNI